jgi:hypothetical protein
MPNNIEFVVVHPDKLREMIDAGEIVNNGTRVSIPLLDENNYGLMENSMVPMDKIALFDRYGLLIAFFPVEYLKVLPAIAAQMNVPDTDEHEKEWSVQYALKMYYSFGFGLSCGRQGGIIYHGDVSS